MHMSRMFCVPPKRLFSTRVSWVFVATHKPHFVNHSFAVDCCAASASSHLFSVARLGNLAALEGSFELAPSL